MTALFAYFVGYGQKICPVFCDLCTRKQKNMVEITFVWDVTASDIAWASAAERKQEILNLVNIKKIDRALPELIERAEAGIEIEVELADGTDAATITYPNIATFNAAARGEATDVNE